MAAAAVLVVLSAVVGALALTSGDEGASGDASVLTAVAAAPKASFETLSPKELRKKARIEEARREIEKIKKVGEEVAPGTYKILDENGEATFFHGDLLPGFGRGGEPLFLTAQFKRIPNVPKAKRKELPPELAPKFKKEPVNAIKLDQPKGGKGGDGKGGLQGQDGGGGGSGSDGGGGG
jgi:uncharacterized membrane protein YgcG